MIYLLSLKMYDVLNFPDDKICISLSCVNVSWAIVLRPRKLPVFWKTRSLYYANQKNCKYFWMEIASNMFRFMFWQNPKLSNSLSILHTSTYHRRRIDTEGKAKVVAPVWGGRICSIPCRASCFVLVVLKETVELNRFFKIDWLNSTVSSKKINAKQLARQGIKQVMPPKQTRRPLPCLLFPSFFYAASPHTLCEKSSNNFWCNK